MAEAAEAALEAAAAALTHGVPMLASRSEPQSWVHHTFRTRCTTYHWQKCEHRLASLEEAPSFRPLLYQMVALCEVAAGAMQEAHLRLRQSLRPLRLLLCLCCPPSQLERAVHLAQASATQLRGLPGPRCQRFFVCCPVEPAIGPTPGFWSVCQAAS